MPLAQACTTVDAGGALGEHRSFDGTARSVQESLACAHHLWLLGAGDHRTDIVGQDAGGAPAYRLRQ